MLGNRIKEQIAKAWKEQSDCQYAYIDEVVLCNELDLILKSEQFDFKFNPNVFLQLNDKSYDYEIPIVCSDIDGLIQFRYE